MMTENESYFENYLKLLELRLFSLLERCPQDNRDDAKEQIMNGFSDTPDGDPVLTVEELAVCYGLTEDLKARQAELLRSLEDSGMKPRIEVLRDRFGLDSRELLLLTAVLASAVDLRFRRLYKLFQNSEEPRMDLLLSLLDTDGPERYSYADLLGSGGKLLSCGLIETVGDVTLPGPLTAYRPARGILSWLSGTVSTSVFGNRAEWLPVPEKDDSAPRYSAVSSSIEMSEMLDDPIPVVSFFGPDEDRLMNAVRSLGAELGRPLLKLDLQDLDPEAAKPLLQLALRDCLLDQAVLVLTGLGGWIDSGGIFPAAAGELLEKWSVPAVILTNRQFVFSFRSVNMKRLILRIPIEGLTGTQRVAVWQEQIKDLPLDEDIDEESLRTLAGQFTLNSKQIRSAVHWGLGKAVTGDRDLSIRDLYEGARMSSMHHLSDLAKRLPSRYTLRDLVLPEKQSQAIAQLIAMARNRSLVLDDWGVGKKLVSGRGISALFTGVPGTGKTLCAQAIAGELGLDIYRVDLSTIISKYIGETEKNLERIFTEAQNSNVILFFDEADSLFGRRSEVSDSHDRYANIEVGYLLQRMETYDGIVLMATNLGANLDEAFARRIHFIIDFPFPDEETRLRLWELLVPENIEKEPDIPLRSFASAFKIAGGGIRNAVVWAVYEAARNKRPLSAEDLFRGVEREYQKMGKVIPNLRY